MKSALQRALRALGPALKELLWPLGRACLLCRRATRGRSLCPACAQRLQDCELHPADAGLPLPTGEPLFCLYAYEGAAKRLVWLLKFDALEEAGLLLGTRLAAQWRLLGLRADLVTWVPMPEKRRRQRGIDHARCLAEALARTLGLPCLPLLARRGRTGALQHTLRRQARLRSAQEAFMPREDAPPLAGKTVCLVDDVVTTGATAASCGALLRQMGAAQVFTLAACRTQRRGE